MLSWLRHRRATAERIDAVADALIGELGVEAYAEARRREYKFQRRRDRALVEPGCFGGCSQDRQAHRARHPKPAGDEYYFRA